MRALLVGALAIVACERAPGDGALRSGERPQDRPLAAAEAQALASSEPLPERFGFGRPAAARDVALVDIDVGPDGAGSPPGSGTPAAGAVVFAGKCAACHGVEGEGTEVAAALVGRRPADAFDFGASLEGERAKTIGSYWPYATTLFDYTRRTMPFDRPGSLTDEEVYAVTAYLLWRNGIVDETATIDARTLPGVRMPARDRFVSDDRERSTRVR